MNPDVTQMAKMKENRTDKLEYISVEPMFESDGYFNESALVCDSEVERVINILVDQINKLHERIDELES